MGRQTIWVLALLVTYAAAGSGTAVGAQQGRPSATQNGSKDSKDKDNGRDNRDKTAGPGKPDERERWKWWLYDRSELGINDQQSTSINAIFESTLPKLRETRQELDKAEDEMSKIIKEHKADLAVVSGQLDRLESARSQHNKTRTLMLYRMHLLLSAEQRTKLAALRARRDADRKEPSPGFRRHP
jgi:Spy/CpxP family protein refolding chaperone